MNKILTISSALTGAMLTGTLLLTLAPSSRANLSDAQQERGSATTLSTITVDVEGVSCANCAIPIRRALKALDGVRDVRSGESKDQLIVGYEPNTVTVKQILDAIEKAGYTARLRQ